MPTAATTQSRLELVLQKPVACLRLTNPPVNVIDIPMMEDLTAALALIESNADIATVVLSGSQKVFSAGVDVAAHTPDKVREMLSKFHGVIHALINSRKVTVACVHGNCLGGGAELAAVCDLVYTSESATWGFPEIKLGCYPPVAATVLSAVVGQKRASELILTGRAITGREAADIGLANRAVPDAEVDAAAQESLDRLAKLSPAALSLSKKAIYVWDAMHFHKGLARAESIYLDELMKTEDAQEGINAFLEKRTPMWKGK
ncbi:MAG TPA: enoyl-CoA hydratase/isomerase family protein [Terriglobales bacterium]|nr:enoyl-CoA hydratase/isomerase family protein [Terriglobales bacterium]